ncbi:MAG TPA: alpha/beta hydrolase [Stellaceae bacterium]|nr:alpha/beta hydrolase [Stellaceae bacterium]
MRYGTIAGRRRAAAGAVALAASVVLALPGLTGCTGQTGDPVQVASIVPVPRAAPQPPRFSEAGFLTTDGKILPARQWLPRGPVKAVILALHGFNDYSNAFAMPAAEWAKYGIATYAYDQRGFGRAPGRGLWPGAATLAADADAAVVALRAAYPGVPVYLLGESMGGAVAIVAMTGDSGVPIPPVDGVVLSAPAVWGWSTMPIAARVALWAGVRLAPSMTLTGRQLHKLASDNLPMLRALSRDPLVIKETRIDTIDGLVDLMDAAQAAAPRLQGRVLLMYGAHDEIVPREPVHDFVAHLPPDAGAVRRLAFYRQGYHMLLRDLEGATVADDVASWILHAGGRLPSGADNTTGAGSWPPRQRDG